jgi:hypothetical protein
MRNEDRARKSSVYAEFKLLNGRYCSIHIARVSALRETLYHPSDKEITNKSAYTRVVMIRYFRKQFGCTYSNPDYNGRSYTFDPPDDRRSNLLPKPLSAL